MGEFVRVVVWRTNRNNRAMGIRVVMFLLTYRGVYSSYGRADTPQSDAETNGGGDV